MYSVQDCRVMQGTVYRTAEYCSVQCTGLQCNAVYSVQDYIVLQCTLYRTAE